MSTESSLTDEKLAKAIASVMEVNDRLDELAAEVDQFFNYVLNWREQDCSLGSPAFYEEYPDFPEFQKYGTWDGEEASKAEVIKAYWEDNLSLNCLLTFREKAADVFFKDSSELDVNDKQWIVEIQHIYAGRVVPEELTGDHFEAALNDHLVNMFRAFEYWRENSD